MTRPSRRALLARVATASASIVPLAGCLAEDADNPDDGDGGDGDDESASDGAADDETPAANGPLDGEREQQSVELEAHLQDQVLYLEPLRGDVGTVVLDVVDEDGEPVTDGRVMVEAGTAQLDTPQTAAIGEATGAFERGGGDPDALADNQVGFGFTHADEPADGDGADHALGLLDDQNQGTLEIEIFPPSDTDYVDELQNSEIIVIDDS